jgi:hypothetical protein
MAAKKISKEFIKEVLKTESSEAIFILLTIDHPNIIDGPIRVVNNIEDITSRNNKYLSYPFTIELPSSKDDEIPQATLTIDNIDLKILYGLSQCNTSPTIMIEVIMQSTPDIVEIQFPDFKILSYSFDAYKITAYLGYEAFYESPYPIDTFNTKDFPGLFKDAKTIQ